MLSALKSWHPFQVVFLCFHFCVGCIHRSAGNLVETRRFQWCHRNLNDQCSIGKMDENGISYSMVVFQFNYDPKSFNWDHSVMN